MKLFNQSLVNHDLLLRLLKYLRLLRVHRVRIIRARDMIWPNLYLIKDTSQITSFFAFSCRWTSCLLYTNRLISAPKILAQIQNNFFFVVCYSLTSLLQSVIIVNSWHSYRIRTKSLCLFQIELGNSCTDGWRIFCVRIITWLVHSIQIKVQQIAFSSAWVCLWLDLCMWERTATVSFKSILSFYRWSKVIRRHYQEWLFKRKSLELW